ncbi:MAG: hypothetical protein ACOY3P_14480 [Planctomycetota bacterium]
MNVTETTTVVRGLLVMWIVAGIVSGCEGPERKSRGARPGTAPVSSGKPPPAPLPTAAEWEAQQQAKRAAAESDDDGSDGDEDSGSDSDDSDSSSRVARKEAAVGVGAKGHDLGPGFLTTPVETFFSTKERITFQIQIPHAMNTFKAIEDRAPKSHQEFMEKIIIANNIPLPELPEGHRYIYDPQKEQLMVEHPR